MSNDSREGGLDAPTRHPLDWHAEDFWQEDALNRELERVYDICHGCRRCVSLCDAFPTLFDLVDESPTFEVDGVKKEDYGKVVEQCYLCDLCYQTKCPYVPPHPWALDFPHLMLRAKMVSFRQGKSRRRDRLITSTDAVGRLATIPLVDITVNAANRNGTLRKALEKLLDIHPEARLPVYHGKTLRRRLKDHRPAGTAIVAGPTTGRVKLFGTCYGEFNHPTMGVDLVKVLEHNGIVTTLLAREQCCGMPKLELGDIDAVCAAKEANIPAMAAAIRDGWDILAPVPSCVLMFKQELPLLFPDDADVALVRKHIFDPFEYLWHRHKAGLLNLTFTQPINRLAYQVACHQRVQNIGQKTRDILSLVPGTEIKMIERCSGHDGSYAVKRETYEKSMKILRPVVREVNAFQPDAITSDCPMAAAHVLHGLERDLEEATHPITLLRRAYGL